MKIDKRKFGLKAIVFSIMFLVTLVGYVFIADFFSSNPNKQVWINDAYEVKDQIMESTDSPRLVIVGGSSPLFGVSAEMMSSQLEIDTINYATHAGLSTYVLDRAKKRIRSGDTVLMILEYPNFWYDHRLMFEKQTAREDFILAYDREFFNTLSFIERLNMVLVGALDLGTNIKSRIKPYKQRYDAKNINEYGDEISNQYENRRLDLMEKPGSPLNTN